MQMQEERAVLGAVAVGAGIGALLLLAAFLGPAAAQAAQVVNVTSNVTITAQLAIAASSNLSNGSQFGAFTTLPQTSQNDSDNNNSNASELAGFVGAGNSSQYINVSKTSNVNVTLCFSANDSLRTADGLNTIPLSGFTWNASARHGNGTWFGGGPPGTPLGYAAPGLSETQDVNNAAYEVIPGMTNMSQNANSNDSTVLFRFWLDIPGTQATGSYFNTLSFKGVRDTSGCGAYT